MINPVKPNIGLWIS